MAEEIKDQVIEEKAEEAAAEEVVEEAPVEEAPVEEAAEEVVEEEQPAEENTSSEVIEENNEENNEVAEEQPAEENTSSEVVEENNEVAEEEAAPVAKEEKKAPKAKKENKVADKKAPAKKEGKSRLLEAFTKDYKYEGLVLLILAIIAITLGVLILEGIMVIPESVFLLGSFPKVFAWVLVVLGAFSMVLAVWPYYKPSVNEVKRITWPTKKNMIQNTLDAFIYTIILIIFFFLADLLFAFLVSLISK